MPSRRSSTTPKISISSVSAASSTGTAARRGSCAGLLHRDGQGRVGLERASFYLELLRYPLRNGLTWQAVQLTAILCLSQVAVASGFLLQAAFEPRVALALRG